MEKRTKYMILILVLALLAAVFITYRNTVTEQNFEVIVTEEVL